MENKFGFTNNFEIVNNQMTGNMSISGLNYLIMYTINIDEHKKSSLNFNKLINKIEGFISSKLNSNQVNSIIIKISKIITEAAYEGIDFNYTEQDIFNLANDIKIKKIDFYDENMIIFFNSDNIFSDMSISCQMDYDSNIEDVTVS